MGDGPPDFEKMGNKRGPEGGGGRVRKKGKIKEKSE